MEKCMSLYMILSMFFCCSAHCMELAKKDTKQDEKKNVKKSIKHAAQWINQKLSLSNGKRGLIQSSESLVFDIIFRNCLHNFGHTEICSFAVNKEYYEMLYQLASERKKLIMNINFAESYPLRELSSSSASSEDYFSSTEQDEDEPTYWNKDGSACAQIIKRTVCNELNLHYWFLANGDAHYVKCFGLKLFESPVADLPKVRFRRSGDICTYGWTKEQEETMWGAKTQLVEYALSQQGMSYQRNCCLHIEKGSYISLFFFKSLPSLIKAFLSSSVRYITTTMKIYNLEDAHIPVDYTNKKLSFKEPLNGLSQSLQNAILRRCAIQYKKLSKK